MSSLLTNIPKLVTESDLILKPVGFVNAQALLNGWLRRNREYRTLDITVSPDGFTVSSYGKKPIDFTKVTETTSEVPDQDHLDNTIRWLLKGYEHAQHIVEQPSLFLPVINQQQEEVVVRHAGIQSKWTLKDLTRVFDLRHEVVDWLLEGIATKLDRDWTTSMWYKFNNDSYHNSFIGDATKPALQRAWYSAKRELMNEYAYSNVFRFRSDNDSNYVIEVPISERKTVTLDFTLWVDKLVTGLAQKPSVDRVQQQRSALLRIQSEQQQRDSVVRRQLSQKNFSVYWDTLKSQVRAAVPSLEVAAEQFATIPLLPEGTTTNRTWGIEVETVRAHMTQRPAGWRSEYDGSLTDADSDDYDGECECSCDGCYDGDHCDDRSDDCYYRSRNSGSTSREFVSPVLSHFNSSGLRQLCRDIPDEEQDTSPGIHVHVGAGDLSVTDVARLLVAYSAIAPLLQPLYHRRKFSYCAEMDTQYVQWWLGAARKYLAEKGSVPSPADICEDNGASRYTDVNVHALYKHGTIEFRAMGPYYNYDHLVRWAWLCREMVNVSKLGLPQATWTRCRSLLDVIKVLRKYGSELPHDKEFDNINTRELTLSLSEQ